MRAGQNLLVTNNIVLSDPLTGLFTADYWAENVVTSGGYVTQILDNSGNGYHTTSKTGEDMPLSTENGKPVVSMPSGTGGFVMPTISASAQNWRLSIVTGKQLVG